MVSYSHKVSDIPVRVLARTFFISDSNKKEAIGFPTASLITC